MHSEDPPYTTKNVYSKIDYQPQIGNTLEQVPAWNLWVLCKGYPQPLSQPSMDAQMTIYAYASRQAP